MADEIAMEDFTFPATIANPPPCLLESPPLWPAVAKHGEGDEWSFNLCDSFHEFKRNTITFRENFCYADDDDDDDDCKEEKMDVLWEDLNEKFSKKKDSPEDSDSPGRDSDHVRVCCVRTLKLSKGNAISWKKASVLVLIRFLLKKGFAMHDSAPSIKKLEW